MSIRNNLDRIALESKSTEISENYANQREMGKLR